MPEEEEPMWIDADVDEDQISWMVCGVDRLNEILGLNNSNNNRKAIVAPLASLAPLVSL
jgi:hypothetical protein